VSPTHERPQAHRADVAVRSWVVNADDDQRADDLERVLDEGALARAAKMIGKWSTAHAQIAVNEVRARSGAHRRDAIESATGADATSVDLSSFELRDEELSSLQQMLDA
jgi:hypothetical protein